MGSRSKTLLTVLLVSTVVGVYALQVENKSLFKGQIFGQGEETADEAGNEAASDENQLPDLKAALNLVMPENPEGDIVAESTIENVGSGSIGGNSSFKYTISIDGQEVFANSDSHSEILPGDAFSFSYPIPRSIYQYGCNGEVNFTIDTDDSIEETNEDNNQVTKEFSC